MASVAVIEDDQQIRDMIVRALAAAGHHVLAYATGADGLKAVIDETPDVVILDLGLPDIDGSDVLRMIRGVSDVPVIVATARDDESEIVALLDAGADEYVVKPFSGGQLEARIRALLRRTTLGNGAPVVCVGELAIDMRARTVVLEGKVVELSRKEFDLLAHLAANNGTVVSKQELFAEVWRQPFGGGDKTIDVHLSWLRRKLGETAANPRYLHSVRGVGVKLVQPQ